MDSGPSGEPADDPPGPDTLPIVGAALSAFRRPFEFRTETASRYGDVVDVSGLGRRAFLVSHPEDIRRVLVTEADTYRKPTFEKRFIQRAFGDSLPIAEGETWRRGRIVAQPVFTMDRIQRYGDAMATYAGDLTDAWQDGEAIEVSGEMKRLTFQVLLRTLFSIDRDRAPDLRDAFEAIATKFRPRYGIVPDWIPIGVNRRYVRGLTRLEDEIDRLVSERRNEPSGERDDLLSALIAASNDRDERLSDERIRDEVLSFLFAGHETTAMTFTYAWYLLATHPQVRDRLEAEVDDVLGERLPTVTDLDELPFLDHVISEALRLYPANHVIPREPLEDVELGGYRVPAGSSIYCSQWIVHRDERWFDEPEAFRPDRWAEDVDRPEYAYFPFGGGPRHCIGMRFARLELQLGVAAIAQRISFEPSEPDQPVPELAAGLSMRPREPIDLVVRRRDGA